MLAACRRVSCATRAFNIFLFSLVRFRGHHAATCRESPKAASIAALRQAVARLETAAPGAEARHLPLGVPEVQAHLPGPGLACGVLHEVAAAEPRRPAGGLRFPVRLDGGSAALAPRSGRARRHAAGAGGFRQALWPRPRPARPRRRPAAHRRDQHRQGRAVGDRGDAAVRGPAGHGGRRDCEAISISPPAAG